MTTGLDSRTGSLGKRGVRGSPSSFFLLATWQTSSLRGDGQSRLSFQSVLRHGLPPAGVLSWIVGVLSPRNTGRISDVQTLPNFHRSRIRPGDACQKDAPAINLPRKAISSYATPMSALGQKRTFCAAARNVVIRSPRRQSAENRERL